MKTCTNCRIEKPIEDFYLNHRAPDGHQPTCKVCDKAYQHDYRMMQRRKLLIARRHGFN